MILLHLFIHIYHHTPISTLVNLKLAMREHKPNPLLVNRRNKENETNGQFKGKSPLEKYSILHVRQTLSENLPQNMQERPMGKYISPCNECHHPRQANPKGISLATVKNAVIIKGKKE